MYNNSLRIISAISFIALVLLVVPVSALPNSLVIPSLTAAPKSEVIVPVTIQDSTGIGAVLFDVRYGTLVLTYVSTKPGTLRPDAIIEAREIKPGVVEIGVVDKSGITGTGTLAFLHFKVTGDEKSSTSLNPAVIEAYDASGKAIQISTTRGEVTISGSGAAVRQQITTASMKPTGTPLEPVVVVSAIIMTAVLLLRKIKT